jgi:hypothetical protein
VPTVHPMASVGTRGQHQTRTPRNVRSGMAAIPKQEKLPGGSLGDTTIHEERWPAAHRYSRQIPGARRCLRWRIAAEQVGREDFELKQAELDKSHRA